MPSGFFLLRLVTKKILLRPCYCSPVMVTQKGLYKNQSSIFNHKQMKRRSVFLATAFAVGLMFTSCSSDDSSSSASGSLEGKWNFETVKYNNLPEEGYEGNQTGCAKDYLQFKANGVYTNGDYEDGCQLTTTNGEYTRSGNTVTLDGDVGTITKLTSSEMKVRTVVESEQGTEIVMVVTFKKA